MAKNQKLKPSGLGDVIANITSAIGIEPCKGCEERKERLNHLFPWLKLTREYTPEEIEFVKRINSSPIMSSEDVTYLFLLYNNVFNSKLEKCNCPGLISKMVERVASFI